MKAKYSLFLVIVILLTIFSNVKAQASTEKENARVFVQKFYDWYNHIYETDDPESVNYKSPALIAIEQRSQYFDVGLLDALREFFRPVPKGAEGVMGLDYDPYLATPQDGGFDYQTGKVRQVGNVLFVDIHSAIMGKPREKILKGEIVVIAEVKNVNGAWKLANFIYPVKNKILLISWIC
jgi:hypothetical protein